MKRIAVMTSGGDAPGMNAAIRAVVRSGIYNNMEVMGIQHGYAGLLKGHIIPMSLGSVADIIQRGGTILYTARCEEFKADEGQRRACEILRENEIEGLIVIGGDGSFHGAQALSKLGVKTIGIPGTIDNDLAFCDETIGYDSAVNTAIESIDKIRDTMTSHDRIAVVEVMGRSAGDIATYVGLGGGAETVLIPEFQQSIDDVIQKLNRGFLRGKRHSIIVVAEGAMKGTELADYLSQHTEFDVRATVLGHIQRGGAPTARDRMLASKLGAYAVELLSEDVSGKMVSTLSGKLCATSFDDVFREQHQLDISLYKLLEQLAI